MLRVHSLCDATAICCRKERARLLVPKTDVVGRFSIAMERFARAVLCFFVLGGCGLLVFGGDLGPGKRPRFDGSSRVCEGRNDGLYLTNECSEYYTACREEEAIVMRCSNGLLFNTETLQCDFRENILGCHGHVSCEGKRDGIYSFNGCSPFFWFCTSGGVSVSHCPADLFFDASMLKCDYKEKVRSCFYSVSSSAPRVSPPFFVTTPSSARPEAWSTPQMTSPQVTSPQMTTPTVSPSDPRQIAAASVDERAAVFIGDGGSTAVPFAKTFPTYAGKLTASTVPSEDAKQSNRQRVAFSFFEPYPKQAVCADRGDGKHSISKCADRFLYCLEGKGVVVKCADGLTFNRKLQRCVSVAKNIECSVVVDDMPLPNDEEGEPDDEVSGAGKDRVRCAGLSSGNHELSPCAAKFFVCSNGDASPKDCPSGLVFDSKSSLCDFPANVAECPEYGKREAMATQGLIHTTDAVPTEQRRADVVVEAEVEFCANRLNGLYADGCTEKYFACAGVQSRQYRCPFGLIFNEEFGYCDYRDYVVACGGKPRVVSGSHSSSHLSPPFDQREDTTPAPVVSKLKNYERPSCDELWNGYYKLKPCSEKFMVCTNGATMLSTCPDGLVFNSEFSRCDLSANVAECSEHTFEPPEDDRCANRLDGFYSTGCSASYFSCSNGISASLSCPDGIVFNAEMGYCDYQEYVPACGGSPRVTTPPTRHESSRYTSSAPPPTVHYYTSIADGSDGFVEKERGCDEMPNGFYRLTSCYGKFITCSDGAALLSTCPDGLVFNSETSQCDRSANVAECSERTFEPVEDDRCANRLDGFYSTGCSASFFSCSNGIFASHSCPDGIVFDAQMGYCDYQEYVPACGGSPRVTTPPTRHESSRYTSSVPPSTIHYTPKRVSPTAPLLEKQETCDELPNGIYKMKDCYGKFVVCYNGITSLSTCRHGLVFNSQLSMCDYMSNTPECAGFGLLEDGGDGFSDTATDAPRVTTAEANVDVEDRRCANRLNGLFGEGCSEKYLVCSNGIAYVFTCSYGLVFNPDLGYCDYRERVTACEGTAVLPSEPTSSRPARETTTFPPTHPIYYSTTYAPVYWMHSAEVTTDTKPSESERTTVAPPEKPPAEGRIPCATHTEGGLSDSFDVPHRSSKWRSSVPPFMPYHTKDAFDFPSRWNSVREVPFGIPPLDRLSVDAFSAPSGGFYRRPPAYRNGLEDTFGARGYPAVGGIPFLPKGAPIPVVRSSFLNRPAGDVVDLFLTSVQLPPNYYDKGSSEYNRRKQSQLHSDVKVGEPPNDGGEGHSAPGTSAPVSQQDIENSTLESKHFEVDGTTISPQAIENSTLKSQHLEAESTVVLNVEEPEDGSGDGEDDLVEGRSPTVDAGRGLTVDAGRGPTVDAGRDPTVDAGRGPTVDGRGPTADAGRIPADDARRGLTVDAGRSPTVDAGRSSTVDTGLGATVDVPLIRSKRGLSSRPRGLLLSKSESELPSSVQELVKFCVQNVDGAKIALGSCRQDFVFCRNKGRPFGALCTDGELFDDHLLDCVEAEACGRTSPLPSPSSLNHLLAPAVEISCDSLGDGYHPLSECGSSFLLCDSRKAHLLTCAEGLFYNAYMKSCDYKGNIAACA